MRAIRLSMILALLGLGTACAAPCASSAPPRAADSAPAPTVVYARLSSATPPIQQQPVMPQPSLRAAVEQTVGIANLRVDYSSPAARGRQVWGEVVPDGQVWRAGANAPTRIELSEPSTIFGSAVPAGVYTILVIPGGAEWTVIFNSDSSGRGFQAHDAAEDVARGTVRVSDVPARERLTYAFDDTTDTSTNLVLDWAGKRVAISITFDTAALVDARIAATVSQAWRLHYNAGRYLLEQEGQQQRALELLQRSQQIEATAWNEWFLARALAAVGRQDEARAHATRALELGATDSIFTQFYAPQVQAALEEWR